MMIIYFSAIGGNLISIPQAIKETKYKFTDDAIGIVSPTYGGGVPLYVEEFINKAFFNTKYLFAVMSYGIFSGAST